MIRRYVLLSFLATLLFAVPADAQRIFRASSIDIEQDARLDEAESRLDRIESLLEQIAEAKVQVAAAPAPKPAVSVSVAAAPKPVQAKPLTLANGSHQVRGEWTFPGGIADHLRGPNHGLTTAQIAGKSQAELERLHSALHEGRATRASVSVSTSSAVGACPGGVCPVNYSTSQRANQAQPRRVGPIRRLLGR